MLTCQKRLFDIEDGITYLNGAYMSPLLQSVKEAGINAVVLKSKPWLIAPSDFFESVDRLKNLAAKLIHCDEPNRMAVIPSVSYGIANVARNIDFQKGDHILLLDKQFSSNYYIWQSLAQHQGLILDVATPPDYSATRGQEWNEIILNSITAQTKVVTMEHMHWTDGTLFDLSAIRAKSRQVGALLVVDASQSLGAFPFDQSVYQADAIVAAGYKSLMGPYALGLAYYGPAFDHGVPIEESWINKLGSEVFEKLLAYEMTYKPGAARYNMGEQSQFIHAAMQIAALEQLLAWGVESVQAYCRMIVDSILPILREHHIWIEQEAFRANHLFGIKPPKGITEALKAKLLANKVFVSYRNDTIRVSPNVYNTIEDLNKLTGLLIE